MIHPRPTPLRPSHRPAGVQDDIAARKRLQRLALRLGKGEQGMTGLRFTADDAEGRLEFTLRGYRVDRRHTEPTTTAGHLVALCRWFESRVRSIERGVESLEEAFVGSLIERPAVPEARPPFALVGSYRGSRSVEECIDLCRAALARLGIPEREVQVTWDVTEGWARLRMLLPSRARVDRRVAVDPATGDGLVALILLSLWLRDRARGYGEGWESPDLGVVFLGHLRPARESEWPAEA